MSSVPLIFPHDMEAGTKGGIEDDFAYNNNVHQATTTVRLGFLKKVYSLLFVQLTTTVVVGFVFMFNSKIRFYIHNNDWLLSLSLILSVVILIALHFKRRETPINLILLAAFTLVEAYSVAVIATFFDKFVVLQALVLTMIVVGGLMGYTFQAKKDFSNMGTILFVSLCCLLVGGLLQIIFMSTVLETVISVAGAIIFSLFIVYDTQNIMKRTSAEEYIMATIELYLDIINLFIYILRILDAINKK